ncbi:hypothetical protein F66182_4606 [Fusarium sp. NRRL 66182]|nr:hypothetical protein F66182_4606 [Fusarium sp. NRRL 66182]
MSLKPQFFLVRPGAEQITPTGQILVQPATAVPLIPVDLLPEWVEVVGAPRSLSPDETKDMGNLGVIHAETGTFKLRFSPIAQDEVCASEDMEDSTVRTSATRSSITSLEQSPPPADKSERRKTATSLSESSNTSAPKSKLKPAQGLLSSRHNPQNQQQQQQQQHQQSVEQVHNSSSPAPKSNTSATPSPCRHWCRSGFCKWALSCHFEHTMPTTPAGLAEVGLTRFPDWWLQARGLMPMSPGILRATDGCGSRRGAKKAGIYVKNRQNAMDRARLEGSEAEDGAEEEDEVKPEPKRGMDEILIDLD